MTQQEALNILKTGANVFLTGSPGAGKTHTVNAYVAWLRERGVEPAITASTGIAATHVKGVTIHSWSGIGVRESLSASDLDAIASKEHVVRRILKTKVLIIDEISMLSAGALSMVDAVLKEVRQNDRPFGGLQILLVGDFFQLPPISKNGEASFAFESAAWRELNPLICYLSEQHRQEDEKLLELLAAIREGRADHTHVSLLMTREDSEPEDGIPRLHTHNADVDRVNAEQLDKLPGNPKRYTMKGVGSPVLIEALKRGCLSPESLLLKEGAVVMATKNNQPAGYVNGTVGVIVGFERTTNFPIVETRDGMTLTIAPADWEIEENGKVRAKITQIPLRLAWAITVHKSQGQSLDAAAIDLSRAFEYGQGYVALSRVRTLAGLFLLGWSENALIMHPRVEEKDREFQELSGEATRAFAVLEETGERKVLEERFLKAIGASLTPTGPVEKRSTFEETLALIGEGKSLEQIKEDRGLTLGTIITHLEKLRESGQLSSEDVRGLAPERILDGLDSIQSAFEKTSYKSLTPAYKKLKGKYSFDELKFARAILAGE
ncbi:MAG: ATP-dependent DNA helicase PIF1 [Parcubacteria bacterium C7867-001]|nr:MAG: ATP-dependent DNA helicase PIF1 [Parcubacteria bacterium C7867-001]